MQKAIKVNNAINLSTKFVSFAGVTSLPQK
jgi:hypothetical protein